jgi:hypothetical protein
VPNCWKVPQQQCHKVPHKKCHSVPYVVPTKVSKRECQQEVNYYVQSYRTQQQQACQKYEVPKCR